MADLRTEWSLLLNPVISYVKDCCGKISGQEAFLETFHFNSRVATSFVHVIDTLVSLTSLNELVIISRRRYREVCGNKCKIS